MNAIIDLFRSLGDVLMVLAMWSGAAGLMWLGDEVRARKKSRKNVQALPMAGPTTETNV